MRVGIRCDQIAGPAVEHHPFAVIAERGTEGGFIAEGATATDRSHLQTAAVQIDHDHVTGAVGVAGEQIAGIGEKGGITTIAADRGIDAVVVGAATAGGCGQAADQPQSSIEQEDVDEVIVILGDQPALLRGKHIVSTITTPGAGAEVRFATETPTVATARAGQAELRAVRDGVWNGERIGRAELAVTTVTGGDTEVGGRDLQQAAGFRQGGRAGVGPRTELDDAGGRATAGTQIGLDIDRLTGQRGGRCADHGAQRAAGRGNRHRTAGGARGVVGVAEEAALDLLSPGTLAGQFAAAFAQRIQQPYGAAPTSYQHQLDAAARYRAEPSRIDDLDRNPEVVADAGVRRAWCLDRQHGVGPAQCPPDIAAAIAIRDAEVGGQRAEDQRAAVRCDGSFCRGAVALYTAARGAAGAVTQEDVGLPVGVGTLAEVGGE